MTMDPYYIPTAAGEAEHTEKRSTFLGHVRCVETEDAARAFIAEMKKQYHDARHNCWCYLIRGGAERYSDDGEPQGSAGIPMLEVFRREGVTNVVCVVTRYFGGVLLGASGLTRAYSAAAALAVQNAQIRHFCEAHRVRLAMDYSRYGQVSYLLPEFGVLDAGSEFGENVALLFDVKTDRFPALSARMTELFSGAQDMEILDTHFVDFP